MPDPTGDQPSLFTIAVALARTETKVDALLNTQSKHGEDIRQLQARRWPLPVVGSCLAAIGVGSTLYALVHPH